MLAHRLQALVVTLFHNRSKATDNSIFLPISPAAVFSLPIQTLWSGCSSAPGQMWKTHLYSNESERVFPLYLKNNFVIS